jgi:hypothetical protein
MVCALDDLKLTEVDRRLVAHVQDGETYDFAPGKPVDATAMRDVVLDGVDHIWGDDEHRRVSAEIIAHLMVCTDHAVHHRGVRLRGARITGSLDLAFATLACPLSLRDCHFEESIDLTDVTAPAVFLEGARATKGIVADRLTTHGVLDLRRVVAPSVSLVGARIGGGLTMDGAKLGDGGPRPALTADGMVIDGDLYLRMVDGTRDHPEVAMQPKRFETKGTIRLVGAHIRGQIELAGAVLHHSDGDRNALVADGLIVDGDVFCRRHGYERFQANGEIRLPGAHIGGDLDLGGAEFTGASYRDGSQIALRGDGLRVDGDVHCRLYMFGVDREFTARGNLRLAGGRIGGQLDLSKAELTGAKVGGIGDVALFADRLTVAGDMALRRSKAKGLLLIRNAHIGGTVDLSGATLIGSEFFDFGKVALAGIGLKVDHSAFCRADSDRPFEASGQLRLLGAHIGSDLDLSGATLTGSDNPRAKQPALLANHMTVANNVRCQPHEGFPFHASGAIALVGAYVGGVLQFRDCVLDGAGGLALDADHLTVTGPFVFRPERVLGGVNLVAASVSELRDDIGAWPADVRIDGFTYRALPETGQQHAGVAADSGKEDDATADADSRLEQRDSAVGGKRRLPAGDSPEHDP